jgi:hypothetical protein
MGTVIIFEPRTLAPLSSATRSSPDWVMQIGPDKSACRKFGAFWRPRTIRFPRRSTLHPSLRLSTFFLLVSFHQLSKNRD